MCYYISKKLIKTLEVYPAGRGGNLEGVEPGRGYVVVKGDEKKLCKKMLIFDVKGFEVRY